MPNPKSTERLTPVLSETLLTLLETLPGALFVVDGAATIVYANASAQTMLGATREDILGKPLWRGAPHLVSTALYQAVQKTNQTRKPAEVEYVSPVTQSWLHVQLVPTGGGLMMHVHELKEPARCQEMVPQGECLCLEDLDGLVSRIGVLTPEGIVLEVNEVLLAGACVRREEVIGQPLAEARWWSCSPASQEQLRAAIARASRGETVRFEAVVYPREGMDRHLDIAVTPCRDADHHIAYLVIAGIDITERKRAEQQLKESRESLRVLAETVPQLVWVRRPDGLYEYTNQRWRDYTGLTLEQTHNDRWAYLQIVHPDDRDGRRVHWQHALDTGEMYEHEHRLRNAQTGEYRWFLCRAMPVRDETGHILKWFGTSTDIHDKKQVEDEIRVLVDAIPQFVWMLRPDGSCEYTNQRWCDYTNMTSEQAQGDGWLHQAIHPDDQQRVLEVWQSAVQAGRPYEAELRLRNGTTGEYRWSLARGVPFKDAQGTILKWFGTNTDIDEQKQAEQQLKESQESLRVLAETVPQLVWVRRPDGLYEYTNQRWRDYTGLTLEQTHNDRWAYFQFIHPDEHEGTRANWQHAIDTGTMYEHEVRLKNCQTGEYRWFLTRAMPVRDDTGQILKWFGTCTDIEEQKRIEEALRESQERVNILMNSSIIGIFFAEGEKIVDANDTYLSMTGYTREDLCAGHINWLRMTPPEYLARTQQARQELVMQQFGTPYEKEYVCKDGSRLPVLVGGVVLQHHPSQAIGFALDNSARKELEQRKDAFISMASHELRNPLTALKLQTTLLRRQLAKQGPLDQAPALASMETQIKTITRLVEELLDVSKIQAGRLEYVRETVDLDALLQEITETLQQTNPSHTLVVRGTVGASLIGDRDRLGQVFTNLISNAVKYSPGAETVEIDLSASEEAVTISVRDHGLGIPREQRDKIFDRFYRASGPKQKAIPGLGMGLYIVAEIVKGHGGTITVDSTEGRGSTFTVTLPRMCDA